MAKEKGQHEKLLSFLEHHESLIEKQKKPRKTEKPKVKPKKKVENQRDTVKKLTKQMMKETEVFSFVPAHVKQKYPTEGFNVRLLEEKLVNKLVENHKKLQSYERPYISVSELLGCLRGCYYYRKKYSIDLKKKFNYPYLYIRQKVGNAVHEAIQDVYSFDEVEKTVISEKFFVKGRLDGLADVYVIDFKPSNDVRKEVDPKHFNQGNIYATILNTEYEYSIKKVVIVYYLLSFKDIQVFVNDVDLEQGLSFLKRGKLLKEHLENNIIVDPIGATKNECQYCPYVKYCQKDGYKDISPPKLKPIKPKDTTEDKIKKPKPTKQIEKQKPKKKRSKKFEYKDPSDGFLL
jgi:CRISPR/Cas system-associated exonuclease Cas4 (RecB family)